MCVLSHGYRHTNHSREKLHDSPAVYGHCSISPHPAKLENECPPARHRKPCRVVNVISFTKYFPPWGGSVVMPGLLARNL